MISYLPEYFVKTFDINITILIFGSELWGIKTRNSCEYILIYASKRVLCVSSDCTNATVFDDCARFHLWIESAKSV